MMSSRVEVIAEFGQTMGGDVGRAVEMVHAFHEAGATGIKVQLLEPEAIATAEAESYWRTGPATTQRKAFREAGVVHHNEWGPVVEACRTTGLKFIGTPFDLDAIAALVDYDADGIKIASGDLTYTDLLARARDAVASVDPHRCPVILSTGASTETEIRHALRTLGATTEVVLLACSLAYPTALINVNLARIRTLHARFPHRQYGYSDHSRGVATAQYAVLAGATWLEKHVTLAPDDPSCPDNAMALDPKRFASYVGAAHIGSAYLGDPALTASLGERAALVGARRAARYAAWFPAGHPIERADLTFLRPCPEEAAGSIGVAELALVGTAAGPWHLVRDVEAGAIVRTADFLGWDGSLGGSAR